MIAPGAIISGANRIPWEQGAAGGRKGAPPAGTFARAGQFRTDDEARTTARFDDADARVWRPDVAGRRPIGEVGTKKKPAAIVRAGIGISFDGANMPVIRPTCQILAGPPFEW